MHNACGKPWASVPASAPILWGWRYLQHPERGVMEVHLMPMNDCGMHAFDTGCICRPCAEGNGFFHHHAFDGREAYERGLRRPH
jgi:hypothetical protein